MLTQLLRIGLCLATASTVLGCEKHTQHATTKDMSAVAAEAVLSPTEGSEASGRVRFRTTTAGVEVEVELAGLEPNSEHGFHIHEKGDCSAPDGTSAGGHYAPDGNPHGLPPDPNRHAGDMGNVVADDAGRVSLTETFDTFSLGGERSVLGRAVILHADRDTGAQPTGAAGARLACGVINATQ
jgi:superoxide dismutase, Cu-Zn family